MSGKVIIPIFVAERDFRYNFFNMMKCNPISDYRPSLPPFFKVLSK